MSFFQHQSGLADRHTSPPALPEPPNVEWGVDRLADQVSEIGIVSDLPDRQSSSKREATTLKRSSRAIGSKIRRETTMPNNYTPSSPPAKAQHILQHSYSVDYQASQGHNRVYEPPPSHKELVESDSRIMEVQQEAGPLPLLLNSYPKQYNNEVDEQSVLEKSILKTLHPTVKEHDEKTIEETVHYASPTNGSYAYSPGSPSFDGVFQRSNGTSPSVNEHEQPFSSPPISQPNGNAGSSNAVASSNSYSDNNNKSSHQNHYVMLPIGRVSG